MQADFLTLQSPDLVNDNFEKLAALFPNCVTESAGGKAIDFDLLRQELGHAVVDGPKERYRLEWPGKKQAIVTANLPTTNTLRPVREDSVDFDTTENLYIEGDNLEVLKLLQESYLGKIKMIYIDPPYNTGKDFVYRDNFAKDGETELFEGGQINEWGERLVANLQTSGRYHSDWLSMMYPRLKLARNLLTEDGVIFISIDDNEVHNLRKLCDEIFGDFNHIATIVWEQGKKSMAAHIAVNHEYCLVFAKDKSALKQPEETEGQGYFRSRKAGLEEVYQAFERLSQVFKDDYKKIEEGIRAFYSGLAEGHPAKSHKHYNKVDERGLFFAGDISQGTGKGGRFEIIHPKTKKPVKIPSGGWRFSEKKLPELLENGSIHFGEDESSIPTLKRYLTDTEYEVAPSVFYRDGRSATKRLESILGAKVFDFPKDENIISQFVSYLCPTNATNDIILDFFSGSATTAHAVMQLNAQDAGNRRFIMVQVPELTDEKSEAFKAGYDTICEIGKERIRRAAQKIQEELAQSTAEAAGAAADYGFRVYRLDSSNMKEVYYRPQDIKQSSLDMFADNIKPDRTADDLLAQVMLSWGLPLSLPIEQADIAGRRVFKVAGNSLYACFDSGVDEAFAKAIAEDGPLRVVFRDKGFAGDTAKINVRQLLRQLSPHTEMKVI